MTSSLPLPLNPPLSRGPQTPFHFHLILSPFSNPYKSPLSSKSHICFSSNPSNSEREESRWLREEQRWLREEQRWFRHEQRWNDERQDLLRQISDLNLQIQALQQQNSVSDAAVTKIASLLQALKDADLGPAVVNRIAENGSGAVPIVLEAAEERKEIVVVEEVRVAEVEKKVEKKKMKALKRGAEGEEVREMQEALQRLGFYSGEEDTEFSSFSTGTESAVKTWQASLDIREDGIMTVELLDRLYMDQQVESAVLKDGENGVAVASVTKISEVQQKLVKEPVDTDVDLSQNRVFLLGENRWEEPSRLGGGNIQVGGSKTNSAATNCISCRGERRLLCTECDGTGEPSIEEQFMDWVDEGAKCPYCEGLGYTPCDVCGGQTSV